MAQCISTDTLIPTNFEPKRVFRWIMEIDGIDSFLLKSAMRPTITVRRWPRKNKVDDIRVVIYDPVSPSGAGRVMEWLGDPSPRTAEIKLLDPAGVVVEHWHLEGVKPLRADFGALDYAALDACTITMDMRCSIFELKA